MHYKLPNILSSLIKHPCLLFFLISLSVIEPVFSGENTEDLLELPLDKLVNVEVVSASRFKQKISAAPSSAEVLTAEDIRSFGWRTLGDALNAIRGLYSKNDRNYSYLGNRGFLQQGDFSSRMLFMIDGRRMNDNMYDTGFLGEEFMLDMNLIDRIEYIPGAGSSVYGANALLGVVNVITKQGKRFNGLNLSGEAGSLDTYRGRATFGKQWGNGADLLVNASQYFSHGQDQLFFPEYADVNGGIAEDMDIERTKRLFGQFNFKNFSVRAGHVDRYKRNPTANYDALFNQKDNFNSDRQTYVDLDYNTQLAAGLDMQIRGFYHWYDYYAIGPYSSESNKKIINYDAAHSHWSGGEIKFKGSQFTGHNWIFGMEFQYDHRQHLVNYNLQPYEPSSSYDQNFSGWRTGVYAQDEYKILDNLKINAGVRLDQHHMLTSLQLNPRLAVIWEVTPKLTAKFLYSSAFRAPNAYEYDVDRASYGGRHNPQNREERIKSYEAVAEWYPEPDIRILGTAFHNHFNRVLQLDPDSAVAFNKGEYNTYGFELQGEKHWDNGRLLKLSWTRNYTRDELRANGSWAVDSPKNMVKLHFAEPLFDNRMRIGFEEIFVDQRRTLDSNIASGYHLMNINLAWVRPFYGLQANLGIYNVLDQRYPVVVHDYHKQDTIAADGRTVRFRLEYGF